MNLRDVLSRLIVEGNAHVLSTQECTLLHGLTVRVYVDEEMMMHLALLRKGVFPSQTEWNTVMRCWPQPLPEPLPVPTEASGPRNHTRALVACWRTPRPEMRGAMELSEGATK
jgi:hypothetical protein